MHLNFIFNLNFVLEQLKKGSSSLVYKYLKHTLIIYVEYSACLVLYPDLWRYVAYQLYCIPS